MFAKFLLSLCLLPITGLAAEAHVPQAREASSAVRAEVASALYVWAYDLSDIGAAVAMARAQGFVPTSRPIFMRYVPEAGGPAWVVYIRPRW